MFLELTEAEWINYEIFSIGCHYFGGGAAATDLMMARRRCRFL
jgi:hypothetical protein